MRSTEIVLILVAGIAFIWWLIPRAIRARRPERYRITKITAAGFPDRYIASARGWFVWWELNSQGKEELYGTRTQSKDDALLFIRLHKDNQKLRRDGNHATDEYIS